MSTETEREKYAECYRLPAYHLQGARLERVIQDVDAIPVRSTYLDVGCGRGEMVRRARERGVEAYGLELVPDLCDGKCVVEGLATDMPFGSRSFDVVSCYDVVEHLPPEEVDAALDEIFRVAKGTIYLTTNDKRSVLGDLELHLTRMSRSWWDAKLVERAGPEATISRSSYGNDEWHWTIEL